MRRPLRTGALTAALLTASLQTAPQLAGASSAPALTFEQQARRAEVVVRAIVGAPVTVQRGGVSYAAYPLRVLQTVAGDPAQLPQVASAAAIGGAASALPAGALPAGTLPASTSPTSIPSAALPSASSGGAAPAAPPAGAGTSPGSPALYVLSGLGGMPLLRPDQEAVLLLYRTPQGSLPPDSPLVGFNQGIYLVQNGQVYRPPLDSDPQTGAPQLIAGTPASGAASPAPGVPVGNVPVLPALPGAAASGAPGSGGGGQVSTPSGVAPMTPGTLPDSALRTGATVADTTVSGTVPASGTVAGAGSAALTSPTGGTPVGGQPGSSQPVGVQPGSTQPGGAQTGVVGVPLPYSSLPAAPYKTVTELIAAIVAARNAR